MSATPKKNAVFQNTDDGKEYVFNGTGWVERMTDTPTPRTQDATWHTRTPGDPIGADVVHASFAAGLERELAAVTKERDEWKRVADGMNAFMERARAKTNNTREGLECLREFDALKAKEAR